MGGDCLNYGCIPSKTFLKSAKLAKDISCSNDFGINASMDNIDINKIMDRVKMVIKSIEPHDSKKRYEELGVDVITGEARLLSANSVSIGDRIITAENIVIATGSRPKIPEIKGLDAINYFSNENIFEIDRLPKHLIIVGGGPIGVELGQGFRFLGSKVTIIDRNTKIFKKEEPEVSSLMHKILEEDGINLLLNTTAKEFIDKGSNISVVLKQGNEEKTIEGDAIFIALGRAPSSSHLNLDKIGIKVESNGYIKVDSMLRTTVKNIYACGDIVGPYQFTHMASYQASIVIKNIIFHLRSKVDYSMATWTTYSRPEVAHVGYTESKAKSESLFKDIVFVSMKDNDRAKTENDTDGFLKLILGNRGRIIGATLVCNNAGDMLPIVSLAIKKRLKPQAFVDLIIAYPTKSEIFKSAGLTRAKLSLKTWHKKIILLINGGNKNE